MSRIRYNHSENSVTIMSNKNPIPNFAPIWEDLVTVESMEEITPEIEKVLTQNQLEEIAWFFEDIRWCIENQIPAWGGQGFS